MKNGINQHVEQLVHEIAFNGNTEGLEKELDIFTLREEYEIEQARQRKRLIWSELHGC